MSDLQWAQVHVGKRMSWHIWDTFTRVPGRGRSRCNRNLDAETLRDTRPAGQRTCELCLRSEIADTGPFGDAGAAVSVV